MIIVVGRGHGGTRVISNALSKAGVFMGKTNEPEGDLTPARPMYEAVKIASRRVRYLRRAYAWDFSGLQGERTPHSRLRRALSRQTSGEARRAP